MWSCEGRIAAVRLAAPLDASRLADGALHLDSIAKGAAVEVGGWWIEEIWDLTARLSNMLVADIAALGSGTDDPPSHVAVLGEQRAHVERGAYFEPYVLVDTTEGPVLVRRGARIAAFTRLVGPCVIGEDVLVAGGKIKNCSVGEHSRVHGELSGTIFIGHTNKVHDGFVGDSVLGRWVNVGAGTITSNLKNSYGEVSLWTPGGVRRTRQTFLGSFIGDHAKLGIGTGRAVGPAIRPRIGPSGKQRRRRTRKGRGAGGAGGVMTNRSADVMVVTGVVGAGANVFGTAMPPKFVPPFAWGDVAPFKEFDLPKLLEVAARVMGRRGVTLGESGRLALAAAWARRGEFTG